LYLEKGQQMEAVQLQQIVLKDGELLLTGLPYKQGQAVDVIVLPQPADSTPRPRLTVGALRQSGLIGMWRDRDDIQDSASYARQLRQQAQHRGDLTDDSAGQ
jgi:hypothetical protein